MASEKPVVIVGGGLAGASAAIEVLRHGGKVVLLEKTDRLGGNSAKASSGMNAALSKPQLEQKIEDKLEDFNSDIIKSGKGLSSPPLVDELVVKSASAVDFLQDLGVDLRNIAQLGGHSHPRTHRSMPDGKPMNIGFRIMSTLTKYLEAQPTDKITIVKRATVKQLLSDESGTVTGVQYEQLEGTPDAPSSQTIDLPAHAVILATGGYSADKGADGFLDRFTPSIRQLATTNGAFATGDGVRLGVAVGAGLVDMDQVQLHPTGYVDPSDPFNPVKFLAPEALRGCGGVLVNEKGERFVNELSTRDAVTAAILKHCGPLPTDPSASLAVGSTAAAGKAEMPAVAYMVMNEEVVNKFDPLSAKFYMSKSLIRKFDTPADLSAALHLPEAAVREVLESYGRSPSGVDPFEKTVFPTLFSSSEPIFVAIITPVLHYCMGGLKFDIAARVLKADGTPIPGLFGAGEVTGGLHGGNRLGGNSLLECVVFGRVAGDSAYEYKPLQSS